ncbi:MAG: hypothetical protein AAFM91_13300 [Pseudomonadota bacterium]
MTARTHVFVATTQGPVPVIGITREESDVSSVVCVNGGSQRAGISNLYYDFVSKGTGVIARETGHGAWRVDIGSNIESGHSWQLAFFLAHTLHRDGTLGAGEPATGDRVIWATGRVQFDRSVVAVRNTRKKLETSAQQVEVWRDAGIYVVGLAPAQNVAELDDDWRDQTGLTNERFPLHAVSNVDAALAALSGGATANRPSQRGPKIGWSRSAVAVALLAVGGIVAGVVLSAKPSSVASPSLEPEPPTEPAPVAPEPPAGREAPGTDNGPAQDSNDPTLLYAQDSSNADCSQPSAQPVPLGRDENGYFVFNPVSLTGACSLRFEFATPPTSAVFAAAPKEGILFEIDAEGGGWHMPVPNGRGEDREYALIVPVATVSPDQRTSFERRLKLYGGTELLTPGRLEQLLEESGWRAVVYRQRLIAADN